MASPHQKRLRKARKMRTQIALRLAAVESGDINVRDVLESPDKLLGRVSVYTLLTHTPKLGKAGVKKTLEKSGVWPMDRVANLNEDQRKKILKNLPPRVANTYPQRR